MKIVNTLQLYVKFDYKTFVVDNYVLEDPSDFDEVLKGEYVYKNGKLFKALKNTVSSLNNLKDEKIFIEIPEYLDATPKKDEIKKNVQSSETAEIEKTEDVKVEKVEEIEKVEITEVPEEHESAETAEVEEVVKDTKSKKKH